MISKISRKTKLYALIGNPIEHSLNPLMQNAAFQALGLKCVYLSFRVESKELCTAINGIKSLGLLGFNVTIPYKASIWKYLDEMDPHANDIGAINTVTNREGKLVGYNTDGAAALAVLKEEVASLWEKRIVIIGAGGAARAISFYLAPLAKNLVILNRTELKAFDLARTLCQRFKKSSIKGEKLTKESIVNELDDVDILLNTTSVGMYPHVDETLVDKAMIHSEMIVFDIVYNPLKTRLLKEAEEAGATIINGLKMLVYQGALSFEIWRGVKPPIDVMLKVVTEAIEGK
jgi:shikimate dehydrogenase